MIVLTWAIGLAVIFGLAVGRLSIVPLGIAMGIYTGALLGSYSKHCRQGLILLEEYAQKSYLRDIPGGYKVWSAISILLIGLLSNGFWTCMWIGATMGLITVIVGGVPWRRYIYLLRIPLLFVWLSQLAILYQFSPNPLGFWDVKVGGIYISVTPLTQQMGLTLLSKAICGLACLYFISLTTPLTQWIRVLKKAKMPAVMVELMYFIYRYIYILLDLQYQMHMAADARLGFQGLKSQIRTACGIASHLLVLAFRRAGASFDAMEARGYDGQLEFLEPEEKPLAIRHWLFVLGYGALLVWVIYIEKW